MNQCIAVQLPSVDYWHSTEVKTTMREKRAILAYFQSIFVGINMLCGLTIRTAYSCLDLCYENSVQLESLLAFLS